MTWLSHLIGRFVASRSSGGVEGYAALNQLLTTYEDMIGSDAALATQTAAVEFALGLVYRCFLAAEIIPSAIPVSTLAAIARESVLTGNAVSTIAITSQGVRLDPVASYEIAGDFPPESWVYEVRRIKPQGMEEVRTMRHAGLIHVRLSPRSAAPWRGVSPLISSSLTAETLAKITRSLKYDASVPTGGIMPLPDGADTASAGGLTPRKQAQAALSNGKGGLTLIDTVKGGFGQGSSAAPKDDWEMKRFGAQVPSSSVDLHEKIALWTVAGLGVPPSLFTSQGAAQRESWRHFLGGTIEPLGKLIAEELTKKLEEDITIYFPERVRSDISAVSRAFASLLKAGVDTAKVTEITGMRL